nr:MAG TPA: major capsid protein [Caudoviricetes sp.]
MDRQELKDLLDSLVDQVKVENDNYKAMFGSADFTAEQRKAKYEDILKITDQIKEVKAQIDEFDNKMSAKLKGDSKMEDSRKNEIIALNAEVVRAALDNRPADLSKFSNEAVEGNFTIDGGTHMTRGDKLLPANMSNDLLYEPMAKNQFRELSRFTAIMNLELPKISFDVATGAGTVGGINNAGAGVPSFLTSDSETAKEIKSTAALIKFERNKFKVFCAIPETVYRGTDVNLMEVVNAALQSGFAKKEKGMVLEKVVVATGTNSADAPVSFYTEIGTGDYAAVGNKKAIKEIEAKSLYEGIIDAICDLEEDYAQNAVVVMRKVDYFKMIKELVNQNATLFGAKPEEVLGVPVKFIDAATEPIVGDFKYSHYNYDLSMEYDSDKDILTGVRRFVVTAYVDHRITMKSAFRLIKVTP